MVMWPQGIIIGITAVICVITHDARIACIILCICILLLFLISWLYDWKRENQLAELASYLTLVQDGFKLPELKQLKEGQAGVLQSEIYKVVVLLREAYSNEAKQKKYMSDMLSNISHQIKTPLAAITIMCGLLETPGLTEEECLEYTAKIDRQVERITWLTRNLLALSQLEADVLELKQENIKLEKLMRKMWESFEIMAEVKNISLDMEIPSGIKIVCDEYWTIEAFSNIVKNCIEHTEEGGELHITARQDNIAANIHIRDSGSGIEKEHLAHIFERFYKAGNTSGGSVGIGLSLARQIILKQNGTISVKSEKGRGTDFYIKLYRVDTF